MRAIDHFASRFDRALPSEVEISAIADSKVSRAPSSDTARNSFGRIAGAWDWLLEWVGFNRRDPSSEHTTRDLARPQSPGRPMYLHSCVDRSI
jgi:hypothetical protein